MTTLNDLAVTSRTKCYADGHQRLLKTHLGTTARKFSGPSEIVKRRKAGKHGPRPGSHKARRLARLEDVLKREGWLKR